MTLETVKDFRRVVTLGRLPRPMRRACWWVGLNVGRKRAKYFGTFGVSVYSALGAESLHPLSPLSYTVNYGVLSPTGELDVRLVYDHRVADGATVARALGKLETALLGPVADELRASAVRHAA